MRDNNYYEELGMKEFPLYLKVLYNIVVGFLYGFSHLYWPHTYENVETLAPKGEYPGRVIICNHTSMPEVVVVVAAMWRRGRRVRPMFKSEFGDNVFLGWLFTAVAGGIELHRGTADLKALRAAQHALKRGEDVLIFPEGTRIRTDEAEKNAQIFGGFALIAQMGKANILPTAVCGFRDLTPAGSKIARPKRVWLRAGEEVSFKDAPQDLKRNERLDWIEQETVARMYAIRDDLRLEHPGRK